VQLAQPGQVFARHRHQVVADYPADSPHDVIVKIVIADQTNGNVLLDETRTAKSRVTREDNCHLCWTAEATL